MELKTNKTKHRIEERLHKLSALKDADGIQSKAREWKLKANGEEVSLPYEENDMRTQVSATVKRQKDAEFSANMPEFSFIPLNDKARVNRKIVRETWKYHWLQSNTDKAISDLISSATTYGTGILFEDIKHTVKKVKIPKIKTETVEGTEIKTIDFEEEIRQESKVHCEVVPFENFFVDGDSIENSTEAIVVRYWSKDEYINDKKDNPIYKNISKVKDSQCNYVAGVSSEQSSKNAIREDMIEEITYYNEPKDEYIILANGIEILNSVIPYAHKQLPFAVFYDNKTEGRFWGMGEFELLEQDELAKNEYRSLTVKSVKASIGFILKEEGADFDVSDTNFGIGQVVDTDDVDAVRHFGMNLPIGAISELEMKVDNDIIAKSGVDFKALHLTPNESATKTANKNNSTRKRINLNLRDNSFGFYRRLAMLRLSNIQLLHMMHPKEIPIQGGSIRADGVFEKDSNDGYGSAMIGENFISGDFMVVPITETMLGDNKQRRKENLSLFMQLAGNLVGEDGKPIIKHKQLAELASEEYGYDFEKLTEESAETQSPDDIVNKVFSDTGELPQDDVNNPNYIPPAQRSGAKQSVQAISGQAKIPYNEE